MRSFLYELCNGNIFPDEQIMPKNPEYRKALGKISDEMEAWKERLSTEQYDRLENLIDLHMEISSMSCFHNFSYGFKLGTLLMMEVLTSKGELIGEEKNNVTNI